LVTEKRRLFMERMLVGYGKGRQGDLENLLKGVEKEFPGVSELLKVYGGYEEMTVEVREYLEMTKPQPFITTFNQTCRTN
jgi:hypothetical protein